MATWTCDYGGLPCHCLPNKQCFGREPGWRFQLLTTSRNFRRARDAHLQAHDEHEVQADVLKETVGRWQRVDEGAFACQCGFKATQIHRVLQHQCTETAYLALPLRSTLHRWHPFLRPVRVGVDAYPFSEDASRDLAKRFASNFAATDLVSFSLGSLCNTATVAPCQPTPSNLGVGDYFKHPELKNAYCCVSSCPIDGVAFVMDLLPFPKRGGACSRHPSPPGCWRFASMDPYKMQLPDIRGTESGPLFVARPCSCRGFPRLTEQCFRKTAEVTEHVTIPERELQVLTFVQSALRICPCSESSELVLHGAARKIFEDIAIVDLTCVVLPCFCPLADPDAEEPCQVRRRGTRMAGKYVGPEGMRLVAWMHVDFCKNFFFGSCFGFIACGRRFLCCKKDATFACRSKPGTGSDVRVHHPQLSLQPSRWKLYQGLHATSRCLGTLVSQWSSVASFADLLSRY